MRLHKILVERISLIFCKYMQVALLSLTFGYNLSISYTKSILVLFEVQ